jgi:error-prone DNA polymerase
LAVEIAGVIINRQRPGTASGIVFMTLEDETDVANLIARPQVIERYRKAAVGSNLVAVKGKVERQGEMVHIMVQSFKDLQPQLTQLKTNSRDFH